MDITNFVVSGREKALLYGDYSTYRGQLSRRLFRCRRKLGITTKNRSRFTKKPDVTAADISQDHGYLHLLLLTSERAAAHAMSMKAAHATDTKGVTGRTRSHIVSRLTRAARTAQHLVVVLSQVPDSGASSSDVLEARAYASLVDGMARFEGQSWDACLRSYSAARVIYDALASATSQDMFRDLLSETIDPAIRYAAYQLKTPRTVPVVVIARQKFLASADPELADQVNRLDPRILGASGSRVGEEDAPPATLTWRSREVRIEDAAIALAWASVAAAKAQLGQTVTSKARAGPRRVAAAYDGILAATQEAADATKRAIDELKEEGASQDDHRMQSLQVTRTAVNYEMISWRIGRNRVLTGESDGALEGSTTARKKSKAANSTQTDDSHEEKPGVRIVRIKEKVALYDGTLHNLDAVKELPGIAADETLLEILNANTQYFQALKSLSLARSHALTGNNLNALALINHAHKLCEKAMASLEADPPAEPAPLNINVSAEFAKSLHSVLAGELQRHRALVHVANLRKGTDSALSTPHPPHLIDRLNEFPRGGVDLGSIVEYPPALSLIPAKPIFLDVAWNHIGYPGATSKPSAGASGEQTKGDEKAPQKRGWFGFGR